MWCSWSVANRWSIARARNVNVSETLVWEDVTPTGSYPADSEPSFFWATEDSIIVTLNRLWQTKYPFTFLSSDQGAHWKNIVPALNQTNVLAATYR